MFWITPLLILAAPPPAAEGRYPDAVEIYHCEFTAAHDTNYDNWPDDWRRQRDPQHPTYVEIGIVADNANRYLTSVAAVIRRHMFCQAVKS